MSVEREEATTLGEGDGYYLDDFESDEGKGYYMQDLESDEGECSYTDDLESEAGSDIIRPSKKPSEPSCLEGDFAYEDPEEHMTMSEWTDCAEGCSA